jgi:hypothetical protein
MNQPFSSTSPSHPPHDSQADANRNRALRSGFMRSLTLRRRRGTSARTDTARPNPELVTSTIHDCQLNTGFTHVCNGERKSTGKRLQSRRWRC